MDYTFHLYYWLLTWRSLLRSPIDLGHTLYMLHGQPTTLATVSSRTAATLTRSYR